MKYERSNIAALKQKIEFHISYLRFHPFPLGCFIPKNGRFIPFSGGSRQKRAARAFGIARAGGSV
jgi:hypothetical protein